MSSIGNFGHVLPDALIPTGTTETVDWDNGNIQIIDLGSATGDVTLTLSNPLPGTAGARYLLKAIQGSPSRQLIWPGSVVWVDGTAPTLDVTDDYVHVFELLYDGSGYVGADWRT